MSVPEQRRIKNLSNNQTVGNHFLLKYHTALMSTFTASMAFLRFKLRIRRTELNKTLSSDVRRPSHALKFNPLIKTGRLLCL